MRDRDHTVPERLRLAHLTTVDMSLALLLATELDEDLRAGHEVLGISAPGKYVERVEALGVRHVPIRNFTRSWSLMSDLRAFVELLRSIRRLKLDVLHTHTPKAGVMGRIAGRLAGVPVVVNTCHGLWAKPDDPLLKRILVYGAEAFAMRFSDFELFQNEQDAATMRRFLKPGKWKVAGNGVNLERFTPDPAGRARVRAEWGVGDDEIVVGTIGRRVREKGLAEFAQAAHELANRGTFVWVGPDDDTDALTAVPHQDAIRFVGEYTDMPAVYSALDVFVLASYREGFSRASMEAAACGKPMVITDIRGCREIGTHEEHLLLVEPRSSAALVQGIARLLDDPELRTRLGRAARHRALSNFDQREVAKISLSTYEHLRPPRRIPERGQGEDRDVVLHVIPEDLTRGAQVYAGRLRDELRNHPEQHHLLVSLFDGPEGAARPDLRLKAPQTVARRLVSMTAVVRLRGLIAELRPQLVVAHGGEPLKYVIPAAGDVPTVYYKVGLSTAEIRRPLHRWLYTRLARRATIVVGNSSAIAEQVADVFGVVPGRIKVIPNGRDPEVFAPGHDEPPGPPRLLWVGEFERGKRPELFVDAVAALRARGLDFAATMVGDGQLRSVLEERAAHYGIELLGVRRDVPELLRQAAILVLTSEPETEGMPGVLIEAALTGVPIVSTDAAGVRDVIPAEDAGYVLPETPRQDEEFATVIQQLLRSKQGRLDVGARARVHALAKFTLRASADCWQELVGGGGAQW